MRILAAAVVLDRRPGLGASGLRAPATLCPVSSKPKQAAVNAANGVIAAPVDPDPRVGAVFLGGGDLHACTGSVLHSATGNLVLTAAHCMSAGGPATFVPGFAATSRADRYLDDGRDVPGSAVGGQ